MSLKKWQKQVQALSRQLQALSLLAKHKRVAWWLKLLFAAVLAYALSPIDLIPDFIPVIGYLDELILLPVVIWLLLRFVPDEVWQDCQTQAANRRQALALNYRAACIVVLVWCLLLIWGVQWIATP